MVNTDVAEIPGEYWLALYAPRDDLKFEMFDFLANPLISTPLIHFSFIFLAVAFNNLGSKVCGHYAVLFCYFRFRDYLFDNAINN